MLDATANKDAARLLALSQKDCPVQHLLHEIRGLWDVYDDFDRANTKAHQNSEDDSTS